MSRPLLAENDLKECSLKCILLFSSFVAIKFASHLRMWDRVTQREINILFFRPSAALFEAQYRSSVGKYLLNPIQNGVRTTWPVAIPMKWLLIHGVLALRVSSCVCVYIGRLVCIPGWICPSFRLTTLLLRLVLSGALVMQPSTNSTSNIPYHPASHPSRLRQKSQQPSRSITDRGVSFFFFCLVFLFICYSILFLFSPLNQPPHFINIYCSIGSQRKLFNQPSIHRSSQIVYTWIVNSPSLSTAVETINSFIDYQ